MSENVRQTIEQAYAIRRSGDAAESLALYRKAAADAADDAAARAHCLRHIGDLERQAGRTAQAKEALREAEALYRSAVRDPLSLANTLRLRALTESRPELWREARDLYKVAAQATGLDMRPALKECDAHLTAQP